MRDPRRRRRVLLLVCVAVPICGVLLLVQYLQLQNELGRAEERLVSYDHQRAELSYGAMTYVDRGQGPVILVAHGMSGGYDQGYETLRGKTEQYRVLAPSRFGYLDSSVPADAGPGTQAAAFVELLDVLGVDEAYVLGTSAGGTVAIRFALDFPERTAGLILYSSAPPLTEEPESYSEYQGPPAILLNDFAMWLSRPLFGPLMGMEQDTIYGMLPVSARSTGMQLDATAINPDMARNYKQYPIEELTVPTLIVGARDDKVSDFLAMERAASRFPNHTVVAFEDGGHMMSGHEQEIESALDAFISSIELGNAR